MRNFVREARKFIAALAGVAASAVAAGLLPEPICLWAMVFISVATALGVYAVPNKPRDLGSEMPAHLPGPPF